MSQNFQVPSRHPGLREMQKVIIPRIAGKNHTVLVYGETGTGKEGLALSVHALGERREKPFVAVNCAALNRDLLTSELFGHVQGAFTGACARRIGKFQQAEGGVIFLDEVREMSLEAQAKFLRALENRTVEPVGSNESCTVNVQVVAATNRNLWNEVREGRFREDLFYRLNVIPLNLPPLRERTEDIPDLIRFFSEHFAKETGRQEWQLSDAELAPFLEYHWPGNIRELKNVVERAYALGAKPSVPQFSLQIEAGPIIVPARPLRLPTVNLAELERLAVAQALQDANGNQCQASEALGISRGTLRTKVSGIPRKHHAVA